MTHAKHIFRIDKKSIITVYFVYYIYACKMIQGQEELSPMEDAATDLPRDARMLSCVFSWGAFSKMVNA